MSNDNSGFVYILSNPSMPGLLKIGKTKNHPAFRADQLYTTGVPTKFKIEYAQWAEDRHEAEANVHEELLAYWYEKEFFGISAHQGTIEMESFFADVVEIVFRCCLSSGETSIGSEVSVVPRFLATEHADFYNAHLAGVSNLDFVPVLSLISKDAWRDAKKLKEDRAEKNEARRLIREAEEILKKEGGEE